MRFYPRKTPRKKADIIVDKLASGKADDLVISELKAAVAEIAEPEELQRISWAVLDIAMNSTNMGAIGYALKSMLLFMPMAEDIENALDNRVLTLVEDKAAASNKVLVEAMACYARERVSGDIDRSLTFIPAMLLFLEESSGASSPISYEVLMSAASSRPEYFEPYSGLLTRELGSINNSTRIYTARIITRIARAHPEYLAEAEKTLLHISTFYPDAEVKSAAAEAYQTITQNRAPSKPEIDIAAQPRHDSTGGLADIMRKKASTKDKKQNSDSRIDNRLLSLAANFARKSDMRNGQAQAPGMSRKAEAHGHEADSEAMDKIIDDFSEIAGVITGNRDDDGAKPGEENFSKEEAELRDMVAKVRFDFSESAESLLDSLGMKHLQKDQPAEPQETTAIEPAAQDVPEASQATVTPETPQVTAAIPTTDNNQPVEAVDADDDRELITSIEMIITEADNSRADNSPAIQPPASAASEPRQIPLEPVAVKEDIKPFPDAAAEVPETVASDKMGDNSAAEVLAAQNKVLPDNLNKATKSPIIPAGVRISAVKFKTLDQSKKPQPPSVVSIKPHIKPLNRTPRDISKIVQQRPSQAATQQAANPTPASQPDTQQKVESTTPAEPTVCPSCNEKIVGDQQYCLKCGTDLKSLKVRCTRCSQINARDTGTCVRCGAKLVKGPAATKQPDIL